MAERPTDTQLTTFVQEVQTLEPYCIEDETIGQKEFSCILDGDRTAKIIIADRSDPEGMEDDATVYYVELTESSWHDVSWEGSDEIKIAKQYGVRVTNPPTPTYMPMYIEDFYKKDEQGDLVLMTNPVVDLYVISRQLQREGKTEIADLVRLMAKQVQDRSNELEKLAAETPLSRYLGFLSVVHEIQHEVGLD